jgi:hypothetical protein
MLKVSFDIDQLREISAFCDIADVLILVNRPNDGSARRDRAHITGELRFQQLFETSSNLRVSLWVR